MKLYKHHITKKSHRKLLVANEIRAREVKATFAQLTPLDEYRIRRLANADVKKIDYSECFLPNMRILGDYIELCYKYAKQVTNTIMV